ncbi:hypothetical protein BQ9231_00252 [Cedratvirus lausannensis]|uniref:Uncharacterized protein n=1 Tax=Cedratvirus lausannensis TaxID=2023205 RepID=A0A285Q1Q4_9VIRU|nr:hypothetical protein BQ9231_00252 [Cedratvirus lausannensis]
MHCAPELLEVIISHMQPREVLKISLLFPDLFNEGMWRSLVKDWDHYSFLPYHNRRKYAEIAYRTCLLTGSYIRCSVAPSSRSYIRTISNFYSPRQQALFAIHKQRKDILGQLVSDHPRLLGRLYYNSLEEDKIFFNRPMFNYLASLFEKEISERERSIAKVEPGADRSVQYMVDYIQTCIIHNNQDFYRLQAGKYSVREDEAKLCFVQNVCLKEDVEFWFAIYSKSQEKEILEKFLQEVKKDDLSIFGVRSVLRNLFRSNHVQLAARVGTKFGDDIGVDVILSCLACYYFNTGDDKGLYESLLYMEERKVLKPGVYISDIFTIELPEVRSLLERNGVKEGKRIDLSQPLTPLTHITY